MTALGWDPFAALNHSTIQILQPRVETNRTKLTSFSRLVLSWVVWTQAQHLLWRHHLRRHCHKKAQMHKITTMMTKFWTTATIQTTRALCVFHWPAPKPHPTFANSGRCWSQYTAQVRIGCHEDSSLKKWSRALSYLLHTTACTQTPSLPMPCTEKGQKPLFYSQCLHNLSHCVTKKNKDWSAAHTEDRLVDAPILNQTKQV